MLGTAQAGLARLAGSDGGGGDWFRFRPRDGAVQLPQLVQRDVARLRVKLPCSEYLGFL